MRHVRDLVDGSLERLGIGLRGFRRPTDLAHVLQRGGVNLVVVRSRFEIVEGVDVAAPAARLTPAADPLKSHRSSSLSPAGTPG